MPGLIRCGALTAMVLMIACPAWAGSIDCWLIDEGKRAEAAEQGLCRDAFARNSQPGEPPLVTAPAAPVPAEKPKPPTRRAARAKATENWSNSTSTASAASTVQPARSGRSGEVDFFGNLGRDLNAVFGLLGDGGRAAGPSRSRAHDGGGR